MSRSCRKVSLSPSAYSYWRILDLQAPAMGLAFAAISNRLGSCGRSVSIDERAKRGSGGTAINNDLGASDIISASCD